ncbi:MAG TPA: acyl carrier protein [Bacteroidia bacterium]|nr:acyl carrier protein [Bacteroidia bacterium]
MITISIKNNASIEARVKQVIVDTLGVNISKVKPEASFIKDFNADSLDVLALMASFEREFNVTISDEQAAKLKTVADVIVYVKTNMD